MCVCVTACCGLIVLCSAVVSGGDEYCYIAYCIHPDKKPSAHALFPPSADALFQESILGYSFPRASVGGGSFWHYTDDVHASSAEFIVTYEAMNTRLIQRHVPSCPNECHCDASSRCGTPYANETDAGSVLTLEELLALDPKR